MKNQILVLSSQGQITCLKNLEFSYKIEARVHGTYLKDQVFSYSKRYMGIHYSWLYIIIINFVKQGLEKVSSERFKQLSVEEDCELLTFIESQVDPSQPDKKLVFHRGNAFYEFSHKLEDITGKKEVVLMDVVRSYISMIIHYIACCIPTLSYT